MQFRFYASPSSTAPTIQPKIDKKNLTIRGVTAMQSGVEALGHGCMTDDRTLEIMLELAQANPKGFFRQRFGHPGISENAAGKQVAQAHNFSIQRGNLVHDSKLLESSRKSPAFAQDPIDFLLTVAEKDPSMFGESVVIDADLVWTLADGREVPRWPRRDDNGKTVGEDGVIREAGSNRPITALTPLPVLRPTEFYYVDFVSEGALTHEGLFPEGMQRLFASGVNAYAEELFGLVDNWIEAYGIPLSELPKKCDQLLTAYMYQRNKDTEFMKRNKTFAAATAEKYEDDPVLESGEVSGQPDPLADLEAMAAQIGQVEFTELQSEPGVIEGLQAQIDEINASIGVFSAKFDRILALLQSNLEATAILQRNVTSLSGEPVVTQRVPKTATRPVEQPQFAHPAPTQNGVNSMLFGRQPASVGSRMQQGFQPAAIEDESLEPAQAAVLRKEQLRKQIAAKMEASGGRGQ